MVSRFPEWLLEEKILAKKEIDHIKKLAADVVEKAVDYYTIPGKPRRVKVDYFLFDPVIMKPVALLLMCHNLTFRFI